jgi:hypothetical protein
LQVNPWFNCHHLAGLKPGLLTTGQPGHLVSIHSHAVSRAEGKEAGQAAARQSTPRNYIDMSASDSRERRPNRFLLSFYHGVIDTTDTPGPLPEVHSTSHISGIIGKYSTKVKNYKFIFFQ